MAHQPATSTKRTKTIHRKQKGLPAAVIPHPNTFVDHTPLSLQPFDNVFHPDTTDDAFSVSAKGRHFSASEDIDYQLDADLLPLSMALPPPRSAHKGSARALGKHRAGTLEPSPTKRFKSDGQLHPDMSSGASPMLGPSTMLGSLPPAAQPMVSVPQWHELVLTNHATSTDDIHQRHSFPFRWAKHHFGALCTPQHRSGASALPTISTFWIWHAVRTCPARHAWNTKPIPHNPLPNAPSSLPPNDGLLLPTRLWAAASSQAPYSLMFIVVNTCNKLCYIISFIHATCVNCESG